MTTEGYRSLFVVALGVLLLVGCNDQPRFWGSETSREIERVKTHTVPSNGSLLNSSGPVRSGSSARANWEIQTGSGVQNYFQWLKDQLGPDYHVSAETTSSITFVKQSEGDDYSIQIGTRATPAGTVYEASFVAMPD